MAARLLEGRPIADKIMDALASEVARLRPSPAGQPKLVSIQIGEGESASLYARNQKKAAGAIGIEYDHMQLPAQASQNDVVSLVRGLNADKRVSAVILQLPSPAGIDPKCIIEAISPGKDAEGIHPWNVGRLLLGKHRIGPCTAMAAMELIASTRADLRGKEAVVVGHSEIVGKPVALMLLDRFATTTVCHIATAERGSLGEHVKRAEVLVVAVGKAGVVKGEWIREGAIVIDVGINRAGGRITGDVEFEAAARRAGFITPVPGGVGPLTTAMLMRNTVELFKAGLEK
jgi:methylenetetrahydrofolate dehydrogenase (NADP+)/methenyltetrahydrofolate cyclohydrolase